MISRSPDLRHRVFEFVCVVVPFCCELSEKPGVVRQIAWQLAAAATSAGGNLEEAKAAYSRRDFAAKNAIALKEMREKSLLASRDSTLRTCIERFCATAARRSE